MRFPCSSAIFQIMMTRSRFVLFAAVGAVGACLPGVTKRPPTPAPVTAPTQWTPNTAGPWRMAVAPLSQKVAITTQAVVVIRGDTGVRTDTLQASLGASYTWTAAGRRKVDGTLTDYRVALGASVPTTPAGLQVGRPFSADVSAPYSELIFRLPAESSACTDPTLSALQGLHDAWIPLPDTLVIGREWSDTVHTLSCRDRVPLKGTSVRRFRVVRAEVEGDSHVIVLVDRIARGRLTGEGEQFGERVAIEGESSGSVRYTVDPAVGRLVRASGTSSLTFSLKSKRRNQSVRQESSVTLSWAP